MKQRGRPNSVAVHPEHDCNLEILNLGCWGFSSQSSVGRGAADGAWLTEVDDLRLESFRFRPDAVCNNGARCKKKVNNSNRLLDAPYPNAKMSMGRHTEAESW